MPKMVFQGECYINSLYLHINVQEWLLINYTQRSRKKAGRSELSLIAEAQMSLLTGLLQLKPEKKEILKFPSLKVLCKF